MPQQRSIQSINLHRGLRWELQIRIMADRLSDGRRPFKSIRDATADLKTCAFCGIQNEYMKRCSGCHWARYCSRKCMENDWPQHKGVCSPDERFPVSVEGIPLSGGRDVFAAAAGHVTLDLKTCAFCGVEKVHMKHCSGCYQARYCSRKCQKNDWLQHKLICGYMRRSFP